MAGRDHHHLPKQQQKHGNHLTTMASAWHGSKPHVPLQPDDAGTARIIADIQREAQASRMKLMHATTAAEDHGHAAIYNTVGRDAEAEKSMGIIKPNLDRDPTFWSRTYANMRVSSSKGVPPPRIAMRPSFFPRLGKAQNQVKRSSLHMRRRCSLQQANVPGAQQAAEAMFRLDEKQAVEQAVPLAEMLYGRLLGITHDAKGNRLISFPQLKHAQEDLRASSAAQKRRVLAQREGVRIRAEQARKSRVVAQAKALKQREKARARVRRDAAREARQRINQNIQTSESPNELSRYWSTLFADLRLQLGAPTATIADHLAQQQRQQEYLRDQRQIATQKRGVKGDGNEEEEEDREKYDDRKAPPPPRVIPSQVRMVVPGYDGHDGELRVSARDQRDLEECIAQEKEATRRGFRSLYAHYHMKKSTAALQVSSIMKEELKKDARRSVIFQGASPGTRARGTPQDCQQTQQLHCGGGIAVPPIVEGDEERLQEAKQRAEEGSDKKQEVKRDAAVPTLQLDESMHNGDIIVNRQQNDEENSAVGVESPRKVVFRKYDDGKSSTYHDAVGTPRQEDDNLVETIAHGLEDDEKHDAPGVADVTIVHELDEHIDLIHEPDAANISDFVGAIGENATEQKRIKRLHESAAAALRDSKDVYNASEKVEGAHIPDHSKSAEGKEEQQSFEKPVAVDQEAIGESQVEHHNPDEDKEDGNDLDDRTNGCGEVDMTNDDHRAELRSNVQANASPPPAGNIGVLLTEFVDRGPKNDTDMPDARGGDQSKTEKSADNVETVVDAHESKLSLSVGNAGVLSNGNTALPSSSEDVKTVDLAGAYAHIAGTTSEDVLAAAGGGEDPAKCDVPDTDVYVVKRVDDPDDHQSVAIKNQGSFSLCDAREKVHESDDVADSGEWQHYVDEAVEVHASMVQNCP